MLQRGTKCGHRKHLSSVAEGDESSLLLTDTKYFVFSRTKTQGVKFTNLSPPLSPLLRRILWREIFHSFQKLRRSCKQIICGLFVASAGRRKGGMCHRHFHHYCMCRCFWREIFHSFQKLAANIYFAFCLLHPQAGVRVACAIFHLACVVKQLSHVQLN